MRPDQPSLHAALDNVVPKDLNSLTAGRPIVEFGPLYTGGIKVSFNVTQGSTIWTKAFLIRAVMALKRYFGARPRFQGLEMSASGPDHLRCSFKVNKVPVSKFTFQYDRRTVVPQSNIIALYVYTDGVLTTARVEEAAVQILTWIESHPGGRTIDL